MKAKTCKHCKSKFQPQRPLQYLCSIECSIAFAKKKYKENKDKKAKKWIKETKDKLRTKKDYIKILQIVFNKFIRKRDEGKGCISCGTKVAEEFHAGHYIPTTYSYLRFNENNVHLQCSRCNTHLRGNLIEYRKNLIKKIGEESVQWLEDNKHLELNLSIEELKELIKTYKSKTDY